MIVASELLDLIDASSLSFADLGGVEGFIKAGICSSREELHNLLGVLSNCTLPDGDAGSLWEMGISDEQISAVIDLDLVRYHEEDYIPTEAELEISRGMSLPDTIGQFRLTELGEKFLSETSDET